MNTKSEKIILTGASDGIGKALALELAGRGHALGLIARRVELLEEVKAACLEKGSPQVLVEALDVTHEEKFEAALDRLDQQLGGCTIFVANAGVKGRSTVQPDAWAEAKMTLSVNTMAAIHGLEYMKVKMAKKKSGTLCGVGSIAASRGMPSSGAYSTSKAAITTHLESLRVDLIPYGIQVVTIAPGFIETPMTSFNHGTMPFLMKAPAAAKIFADGLLAGKAWVVAPWQWRFIYPIMQMIPRSFFDAISQRIYRNIRGPK